MKLSDVLSPMCIFFTTFFGVFVWVLFPVKVHLSFIHSIIKLTFFFPFFFSVAGKKYRFFIHSIDFSPNSVKNELLQVKKNTILMVWQNCRNCHCHFSIFTGNFCAFLSRATCQISRAKFGVFCHGHF